MERIYSAAVVGAGTGGGLSMAALTASPRYTLVAVADMRPEALRAARERYPGIATYGSYAELFATQPTDVVCVSTWPPSHLEVTRAACRLPLRGILVEKPLSDNARDGRAVLETVRAAGLPMATPHNLAVLPYALEILDRVAAGEIGTLQLIEIECQGWDIINAGIHWLHYAVMLSPADRPLWVLAAADKSTRTYRDGMQVETMAVTYVQFASGLRVVMQTGDDVAAQEGTLFRLIGSEGSITFQAWVPTYRLQNAAHPRGEEFTVPTGPRSGHQRHLENLATQMDRGEPDYTIPTASLTALELCEGAYLSARYGCRVPLPLTDWAPPPPNDWLPGQPYRGEGGGRDGRKL
ncbi:MAG: Gfo/Idh/MocA family oxidoreductase [Anaerolineales bacterium]